MAISVRMSDPGFDEPVPVDAIDASCSWDVEGRGAMSMLLTLPVFNRLPFENVLGRWISVDTRAGLWGGVVSGMTRHLTSRTVEINGTDFRFLLEGRVILATADITSKTPGGIVQRIMSEADRADPLQIDNYLIDLGGEPIAYQIRVGDIARALDGLADQTGGEWRVKLEDDLGLTLEFQRPLGEDLTGEVCLIEGIHVYEGSYAESIINLSNEQLAIASDEDHENATRVMVNSPTSIALYGKRQSIEEYPRMVVASVLRPIAYRRVVETSLPTKVVNLQVVNIGNVYNQFREGDRVRLVMHRSNIEASLRVTTRSYADNILSISGDVEEL